LDEATSVFQTERLLRKLMFSEAFIGPTLSTTLKVRQMFYILTLWICEHCELESLANHQKRTKRTRI